MRLTALAAALLLTLPLATLAQSAPAGHDPAAEFASSLPEVTDGSRREHRSLPDWMQALGCRASASR